ncbi:MAG: DEAD/DEAH box helicase [Lachnospiraceae bacterium]|nr:DEAD/DEAH box helicase [Lachnospiraceae bacterium]
MTFTRNTIQALAGSRRAYEDGNYIYQMGQVKLQCTKSFWKDEIKVIAEAHNDHETEKQVNLTIRGGKIVSSRCSCMHPDLKKGHLCAHAVAAALGWLELMENQNADSAEFVRPMIEAYGQIRQLEVLADYIERTKSEEELVHLMPVLSLEDRRLALKLKIGSSKYYKVRDISAFVETFRSGGRYLYGKYLDFYHVPEAFDQESVALARVLAAVQDRIPEIGTERHMSENVSAYSRDNSTLLIGQEDMDLLFQAFTDPLIETEEGLSSTGYLKILEENPDLSLVLRYRSGLRHELGVNLILRHKLAVFAGNEHLYVVENEVMRIADAQYSKYMKPFLLSFLEKGEEQPASARISDQDMPGFCVNVLPVLQKYAQVDCTEVVLSDYMPRTLRTEFFFDRQGEMEITLKIIHHYGEQSFNPITGENPSLPWRDRAQEKRVALAAAKYFERRYSDKGLLTTYEDEQMAIRLAANGFADFMALGEIHLSDSLLELKIRQPSNLQFHVQAFSDWLELSIDMDGIDRSDLVQILNQYEEKKSCYRMKDGSYVMFRKQELSVLPELMEGLQISSREIAGKIQHISGSRALYLKKLFESHHTSYSHDEYFSKLTECLEKKDKAPEPIPTGLKTDLREYQIKGYQWLAMLDRMGFGGILADDMGLGKTVQMIALFQRIYRKEQAGAVEERPSLIVCPSSLLYNWEHEISRFAPELTSIVIAGNGRERKGFLKEKPKEQIWITSYDLLRRDVDLYAEFEFRLQVLDEAQYIKNQGTQNARAVKKIHAVRRFALTGTPVENRLGELWSIFDYLMPGFLYSYNRFHTIFEVPLVKDQDERVVSRLHNMISPFILRRLKKDVLTELPEKCDSVLYPALEGEQKKLYTANAYRLKKHLEHETEDSFRRNRAAILADLTRLRELCCAPSLIYEDFTAPNAKMEALMELVHSCLDGNHRILIFSQFARMLDLIEQRLYREKIPCFTLTGQTGKKERQQLVERFGEGEVPIFLISLKAGGTGLNLTQADTVIHYDPWWNVAAQNQATDRAHRIGQTREVNVYRLIAAGTIEENILKLQEAKQNLVDQVLTGNQISLAELTKEELMKLL